MAGADGADGCEVVVVEDGADVVVVEAEVVVVEADVVVVEAEVVVVEAEVVVVEADVLDVLVVGPAACLPEEQAASSKTSATSTNHLRWAIDPSITHRRAANQAPPP